MFYQQKSSIVSIISTLLGFLLYGLYIFNKFEDSNFESTEEFKFWATAILLLVPVLVVMQIITKIIFIVINTVVTGEDPEIPEEDEFDKLVDMKATLNFSHVFMAGFFLSMGSQVIEMQPSAMFIILFVTSIVGGVVMDLSKIYFYRRGF